MKPYDHKKIEKKWQQYWEKKKLYEAKDNDKRKKFYALVEFPFPSGDGLHVGHIRSYTALDIISRKHRAEGQNVLYPIGWDAFGLPTENYAIKTGIHPKIVTKKNTDNFRRQLKAGGYSFDWSREVNTSSPEYYKWTQWIFLEMYKRGLAYKKKMVVNWCPKDKIGLANEEVIDGKCERCGTEVEKREKEQWMLAITKYADRLDKDLDTVNFLEKIKIQQRNWIGRSEGAEISFELKFADAKLNENRGPNGEKAAIPVFTTRADTLFGVTYIVLAPEHPWVTLALDEKHKGVVHNADEIRKYVVEAKKKDEAERTAADKTKTGVEIKGVKAINPATGEEVPMFVGDYVLAQYGTGAVMAVPAHDERDFAFATKYNLPIKEVVIPRVVDTHDPPIEGKETVARKAVQVILIDPKTQKVLMLKWKKFPWTTFITGGVEGEEDIIEAAKREVFEETGYKNVTYKKTLGGPVESHFYANHKGVNRIAWFNALVFELANDEQEKISAEEEAIHNLIWMSWDELKKDSNIKCSEYDIWLDRFFNEPHAFSDEGVLWNSGEFTKMRSEEARNKIAEKYGKIKVTYKLRDWVFSRQRYWGEPIPMVYCEHCAAQKPKVLIIHGLSATPDKNWYQDVKTRLEKRGYEVLVPDLPKSENVLSPKDWLNALAKLKINKNEELSIIGHSLGGATAIQYILKNNRKVKKLILVAPAAKVKSHKHLDDKFTPNQIKTIINFENAPINFKKLNALVESAKLVYSEDDPIIPFASRSVFKELNADLMVFKDRKHFSSRHNIYQFPELEQEFTPVSENRGWVPLPEKELPLKLPEVKNYVPTDNGESPLAAVTKWVNTKCPVCGGKAHRETDTMPNWAGSSWYYLRYIDPKNKKAFADPKKLNYWSNNSNIAGPVDWYNGGMEHTTLHLLYSRFWHKFLYDIGQVSTIEPYMKRTSHGLILAEGGEKMSKSKGNVVNPDGIIESFGADTLRLYEMFMGPFDQPVAWSTEGIIGPRRFIEKVWRMQEKVVPKAPFDAALESLIHQTIKKVSEDIDTMSFNTAVSSLMILGNALDKKEQIAKAYYVHFIKLLAPFIPHVTEEIWNNLGNKQSIHLEAWQKPMLSKIQTTSTIVVQVNGKVRGEFETSGEISEEEAVKKAQELPEVAKWTVGKEVKKVIFVKGKLVNIVVI